MLGSLGNDRCLNISCPLLVKVGGRESSLVLTIKMKSILCFPSSRCFNEFFYLLPSSNCVVNLSPDKRTVLQEAYRMLKVLHEQVECIVDRFLMAMGRKILRDAILIDGKCTQAAPNPSALVQDSAPVTDQVWVEFQ